MSYYISSSIEISNPQANTFYCPNNLKGFFNKSTNIFKYSDGQKVAYYNGYIETPKEEIYCKYCKCKMHKPGSIKRELKHTPSFDNYSILQAYIC